MKSMTKERNVTELNFKEGDYVVYPVHGVGKLMGFESYEVEGHEVKLLVISFDKERMVLRIPMGKASNSGLRPLSSKDDMNHAMEIFKQKAKIRRTMWSRRAQEYETKINSGDPKAIAEVIRDLYRNASQPDQSYSERQIYQVAIERFARELAVIESIDEFKAVNQVEEVLRAA